MSKFEQLLEEFEALPPHFQSCVMDSRSRWTELCAAAIYADRFGVEVEMPARTNERAVDFVAGGSRVQHKFMTKRGFIKLRADQVDSIDEIMVTVDLGEGHRFFVIPMAAYLPVAKSYGPYSHPETGQPYQPYVSLEVQAARVPKLFGQYEITTTSP